ncbi:MBG domain-containing protein [Collinsella aerofaciens]|uniref:MBG domain-containing protein n=1 Tax=Collinsella aerofaciens TaxID=74426 RepID=UPI00359C4AFB
MLSLTLCSIAALSATLFASAPSTNAYAGETASYDLNTKTQLTLSLDIDNKYYDGKELKPKCEAIDPTTNTAVTVEGKVSYVKVADADGKSIEPEEPLGGAPKDAGTYRVTYTVTGTDNYLGGSVSQDVRIYHALPNPESPALEPIKFREGLKASEEPFPEQPEDGTWSWTRRVANQEIKDPDDSSSDNSSDDSKDSPDVVTALAMFTPKDTNYAVVYRYLKFEVYKDKPAGRKRIKLSITAANKTYDGQPYSDSLVTTTAVDAETGEPVEVKGSFKYYPVKKNNDRDDPWWSTPSSAGGHEVVWKVKSTDEYLGGEVSTRFLIEQAPAPTITVNDAAGTWRGSEPAYTYTVSGLVEADKDKDVLAKGTKAELDRGVTGDKGYKDLDAGVYPSAITVKDPQLNKSAGANYKNGITVIAGTLTVSPLTPKAAVDAKNKTYNGTPAKVNVSITDPITGEKLDGAYGLTYYRNSDGESEALDGAPVDAGSYTVVMNVPARTNYGACEARCDFTIAKAPAPTITVKDASAVFGEPEPAYSYEVSGLVGGDKAEDVIAQGTVAALDSKLDYGALDAGEHKDAITVANPQLSEKGAVNYKSNIKVVAGTLTIEPANVTGTIAVEDKTYDGRPVEPAVEIADAAGGKVNASYEVNYYLLDGDERTEDLGTAAPKNAGSYEAVLRVTDTVNYRADDASCTFTIDKAAAPTLRVADTTGTWHGTEPGYVVTVEGLADGETADSVIQSTAAALDFQKISQDTGSSVTSYADLAVGTYADAITVANAQLTDAGKVNYQSGITVIPGTLTIEVTPLTLKLDVASKTYDGAPVAAVWSVVDPLTGNALNDLGTLTYYEIVDGVPTKLKEAPTNAGTYLAELSANVPASYTAEPITASFSIYRATPNPDTPQFNDLELRDGLTFADVTIPNDPNGSWSWADSTCAITEAGTESGLAIYTPVDTQNFSRTTRVLSFNVVDGTEPSPEPTPEKPKPTLTVEVTSKVYDGAPASITTEVHDAMPMSITAEARDSATGAAPTVNGTLTYFEVTDDSFTKLDAAPVNAGHYAVLFEVAETDEYAAGSVTTIFDIYRAAPTPQAAPHPDPTRPDPALPDLPLTGALKLGDLQLPADDEGTWAWVAPETALTATGSYRFLACYTPNDARNYASVFGWWTVNVVDAAEPNPEPTPSPTPNPADPGNTKTTKTVTTTTSTASKIPNTGDRTLAIVASLGIAGGIIVAAALMFIKRRA